MTEDFYDLLDVPPDASQDEIREAYREKVRVYHPDVNDDDRARAQFTAVKKAHEILADPVERQAYDRLGHRDYVAKRTSGIPSPEVWSSSDDGERAATEPSVGGSSATAGATSTSRSGSGTRSSSASGTTGSATGSTSRTASRTRSSGGQSTGSAGRSETNTGASTGTGPGGTSASSSRSHAGASGTTTSSDGGTAGRRAGAGAARQPAGSTAASSGRRLADNPVVRWWRRQHFALPLIWLSVLIYATGLAHFALENEDALAGLAAELAAVGADPAGLWTVLADGRHGLETPAAFVTRIQPVAPPIDPPAWDVALAGVVAAAVAIALAVRVGLREETWRPITINETILLALAVTVSTTLRGGPLLAGAVLMPLLFGVIVRHTRLRPGWKPSYLYVVPVLAPIAGLGAGLAGYGGLPAELLTFVVLPLAGASGLPLRATIMKRFGR